MRVFSELAKVQSGVCSLSEPSLSPWREMGMRTRWTRDNRPRGLRAYLSSWSASNFLLRDVMFGPLTSGLVPERPRLYPL